MDSEGPTRILGDTGTLGSNYAYTSKRLVKNLGLSLKDNLWVLDSGATEHMCGIKGLFKDLTPIQANVQLADGSISKIEGKGSIELEVNLPNRENNTLLL